VGDEVRRWTTSFLGLFACDGGTILPTRLGSFHTVLGSSAGTGALCSATDIPFECAESERTFTVAHFLRRWFSPVLAAFPTFSLYRRYNGNAVLIVS
jgi:hypothetical protein